MIISALLQGVKTFNFLVLSQYKTWEAKQQCTSYLYKGGSPCEVMVLPDTYVMRQTRSGIRKLENPVIKQSYTLWQHKTKLSQIVTS